MTTPTDVFSEMRMAGEIRTFREDLARDLFVLLMETCLSYENLPQLAAICVSAADALIGALQVEQP